MKTGATQVILPEFYGEFACIGPACKDNCCHTWQIAVDKAHYLRYRGEKDPAFRAVCKNALYRPPAGGPGGSYAQMRLDSQGRCPFQDPDGGCRIYRLLGPDALCDTCAAYPRRRAQFSPGTWEVSLSMSCEEVVRLGLLGRDKIRFLRTEPEQLAGDPVLTVPLAGIGPGGRPAQPPVYGEALRRVCLALMGCRRYTVPERILAAGLLLRRVDRALAAGADGRIAPLAEEYLAAVEDGQFQGFFDRLDYDRRAHLSAMGLPLSHLMAGSRRGVLEQFWTVLEPRCVRDPATGEYRAGEDTLEFLLELCRTYADGYLEAHAFVAENYFVSYLFSGMFPFLYRAEGLSFEQHAVMLAEQYAMLRMLLAVFGHAAGGAGDGEMTRAVVALARSSQHTDLGGDMARLLQTVELEGLAHAAYLLR